MRHPNWVTAIVLLGCVGVFQQPTGPASIRICPAEEPGERIVFAGRILDHRGAPISGAAVQAYNTGRDGLYCPRGTGSRMPRIRGTALTDADGRFRIETVMPGSYPGTAEPAHIHVAVLAPVHHVKFVGYLFEGDRFITAEHRREAERRNDAERDGETVIVKLEPGGDGFRTFHHEIRLVDN